MSMSANRDIETLLGLLRTDDSVDAPDDAVRWAKNLFAARSVTEPKSSLVRRILATLVSDLRPNAPVFGQRSAGAATSRQLLFDADENAVDLRIESSKAGAEIRGQIIGDGFEGATVRLTADNSQLETTADDMSMFNITGVPSGRYTLVIGTSNAEIHAENIVIGE